MPNILVKEREVVKVKCYSKIFFSEGNENTKSKRYCISMFIAMLFKTSKIWKHSKSPLIDEWIRNPAICNDMDGP